MSKKPGYVRSHKRAPIYNWCLYDHESYGLKAKMLNISEGGMLVESLPAIPTSDVISFMVNLVEYPNFSMMNMKEILKISAQSLNPHLLRVKASMVRKVEGSGSVDQLFVVKIGLKFVSLSPDDLSAIQTYVERYSRNLVYLLSLFESGVNRADKVLYIRHVAELLGYDNSGSIAVLRQRVLHDYQSQ
jgi:hypothetical protein